MTILFGPVPKQRIWVAGDSDGLNDGELTHWVISYTPVGGGREMQGNLTFVHLIQENN